MNRYEATRKALGFRHWWLIREESSIAIVLDGKPVDAFVQGKGIEFQFGSLVSVNPSQESYFVMFQGSKSLKPLTLCLLDFTSQADSFSESFEDSYLDENKFCEKLSSVLENLSESEEKTETIQDEVRIHTRKEVDCSIKMKYIGLMNIPVANMVGATEDKMIRPIDLDYVKEIVRDGRKNVDGLNFLFPPAIGNVETDATDSEIIEKKILDGEINVEIIDGNHTTMAMQTLGKDFPEEETFQTRKVKVYKNLSRSEALKLGLKGNEIASNAKPTSEFDILRIIRQQLKSCFNGTVSQSFRRHIEVLLDITEAETTRQKRASEWIKFASMEDECWGVLTDVFTKYPTQKSYIFNDLCHLSKEQALPLLQKVATGTMKPAALPSMARSLPGPPVDIPIIVQVGRNKERKFKGKQCKMTVTPKRPSTEQKESPRLKKRIQELEKEIASKDRKIQDLELQISKEKLEVQHLTNAAHLKEQKIQMLEEANSTLKQHMKDIERNRQSFEFGSLPFQTNYTSVPRIARERQETTPKTQCTTNTTKVIGQKNTKDIQGNVPKKTQNTNKPKNKKNTNEPATPNSEATRPVMKKQKLMTPNGDALKATRNETNESMPNNDGKETVEFEMGEKVWALWGQYKYPAKIVKKTKTAYQVLFEDKVIKTFERPVSKEDMSRLTGENLKEVIGELQ